MCPNSATKRLFAGMVFATLAIALSGEEGTERWRFAAGGEIVGSPAADSGGNLYFGSRDGKLYSLNEQGALRWSYATGDWIESSPTLSHDESVVYVGSWDNYLYAISTAEGVLRWRFETGSLVAASPALDRDGNLFFGSSDGFFYSLTPAGALRWSYFVGEELDASPAVAEDGSVYVGAYDGVMYAFANDGRLKWEFAAEATEDPLDRRIKSPPSLDAEGTIYFGAGSGQVHALEPNGKELWRFDAADKVDTSVVVAANGTLVFGCRDGFVYAVDTQGVLKWESFVGDIFYSTPAVDEFGRIYVGAYLGNGVSGITALSMSGELLWESLTTGYIDSSPLLSGEGKLYFGDHEGLFYAVEALADEAASSWSRFGGDRYQRGGQKPDRERLTVSPAFSDWLQGRGLFGQAARPDADADGDGYGIALEYWLGGEPDLPQRDLVRVSFSSWRPIRVELEFNRRKDESRFLLDLQTSADLKQWVPAARSQRELTEEILATDDRADGTFETVRLSGSTEQRLFFRMRSSDY